MAKVGKRFSAAREAFTGKEALSVQDAVALVKGSASAKFDETVEIAMNLGVDPASRGPNGSRCCRFAQWHR